MSLLLTAADAFAQVKVPYRSAPGSAQPASLFPTIIHFARVIAKWRRFVKMLLRVQLVLDLVLEQLDSYLFWFVATLLLSNMISKNYYSHISIFVGYRASL